MDELQQKEKNTNIKICDFEIGNQNIIEGNDAKELLCKYEVIYTPREDDKDNTPKGKKFEMRIYVTNGSENCNKLDDFKVFVGEDIMKLPWTTDPSKNNENEVWQYLTELKKELNTFNDKKGDKNFRDALCIMIFYHAVKEHRFYRNSAWAQRMKEDDFKQYQEIIEKTIKEQETANKNNKNIVVTNDKTSFQQPNPKASYGGFYDFFNKCCCCCCRNDETATTNNYEVFFNE